MNKQLLHDKIIQVLEEVCKNVANAAMQARDTATNKEMVAENKYDTFGLEASYLAHGQSKRVLEYEQGILAYKNLGVVNFSVDAQIGLGALIKLEDRLGVEQYLYLGPAAGGLKFHFYNKEITLITTSSPLGQVLMNRCVGDEIQLTLFQQNKSYEIIAID